MNLPIKSLRCGLSFLKAISEFEVALETGDEKSVWNARAKSSRILLSHVQTLRHGSDYKPPVGPTYHKCHHPQEETEAALTRPLMLLLPSVVKLETTQ